MPQNRRQRFQCDDETRTVRVPSDAGAACGLLMTRDADSVALHASRKSSAPISHWKDLPRSLFLLRFCMILTIRLGGNMAGGNENSFGGVSHGPLNGGSASDVETVPLQAWALALDTRHSARMKRVWHFSEKKRSIEVG
jgi:hypothetical protein